MKEWRTVPARLRLETRSGSGLPAIAGYAAVFDQPANIGSFTETVRRGTFTLSLREFPVVALWSHDERLPLGGTADGRLQVREDGHGLYMRVEPTSTSYARDLVENIRQGVVRHQSFGFSTELDRWSGMDQRELLQARLHDTSPCLFPAYQGTDVGLAGARSAVGKAPLPYDNRAAASMYERAMSAKDRATCSLCGQPVTRTGSVTIDWRSNQVTEARCPAHMQAPPESRTGVPARATRSRTAVRAGIGLMHQSDRAGARRSDEAALLGAAIQRVDGKLAYWQEWAAVQQLRRRRARLSNRTQALAVALDWRRRIGAQRR